MRLIDADRLKQEIATIMPSRVDVNLVVDAQPNAIVRCKDCGNQECEGHCGYIVCGITGESHPPTWFCADGERKEVL